MSEFHAQRTVHQYRHRIDAAPERIFPLLCPVRDYDWIASWRCEIVYSQSGVAELGCIFTTDFSGEGRSVWTVSRYEPNRRIEFVVIAATHVKQLAVELEEAVRETELHWRHTLTGRSEQGNILVKQLGGEPLDAQSQYLDRALKHYLRTGEMLREAAPLA